MKTIGLLGGMSWESTVEYYRLINLEIKKHLGGLHSAKISLCSVDFAEVEELQLKQDWLGAGSLMAEWARRVEGAGAECLVLCTNTMHKVADAISEAIKILLLHIADATARQIQQQGCHTVGLLGTRYTMEQDFYRGRLEVLHGLKVLTPNDSDRAIVHEVIYKDLCSGIVRDEARAHFVRIVEDLGVRGAQGVILGCTEIGLLIKQGDTKIPLFDTTIIHAQHAARWSVSFGGDTPS